ncbi:hypothetical protein MIND_01337500 [Mycena indigotica]|uniref:Uncharacterized protein n=1 Tax=Mycena indigotica TaxID=2126181 RepID=A0A8H6VU72_9AGAR|nr:uncharacterized protein MIND_01337500 [Mycena indigotica]KAF7290238.1 hypothetical protein MIND_01337500 [Mycena indigotica]
MTAPNSVDFASILQALQPLVTFAQNLQPQNTSTSSPTASLLPTQSNSAPPVATRYARSSLPTAPQGYPNTAGTSFAGIGFNSLVRNGIGPNSSIPRFPSTRSRPGSAALSSANDRRLSAAEAHGPTASSSQLPIRRARRGPARHAPSTTSNPQAAAVLSVRRHSEITLSATDVAIRHVVFTPTSSANLAVPQTLWNEFLEFGTAHGLILETVVSQDITLGDMTPDIINWLEAGPGRWKLGSSSTEITRYLRTRLPSLQHLRLLNKGTARGDGSIMLGRVTIDSMLSVSQMLTERASEFAKHGICLRDNRLHIFWVIANNNVSCVASVDNGPKRRHSACIPALQHALFCSETSLGVAEDWEGPAECESGGETDDEFEIDDILMRDDDDLAATPTPRPRRNAAGESASVESSNLPSNSAAVNSTTTAIRPLHPLSVSFQLRGQGAVFADYTPPAGTAAMREVHFAPDLAVAATKAASDGNVPAELIVEGETNADMAQDLIRVIKDCYEDGHFDMVLTSDRTFRRIKIDPRTGEKKKVADGMGVEREVVYAAFQFFTQEHAGQFLLHRADDFCSIATIPNRAIVSEARKASMAAFGCVTALMLVHQMAPSPLISGLILLPACRFDMRCFTRAFLEKNHPELALDIMRVKEAGHLGDISDRQIHFSVFHHDIQVAQFNERAEPQHEALLSAMVLAGIIGGQQTDGPEAIAWYTGLNSLCSNGFSVLELLRSAPGGVYSFLETVYGTIIRDPSDFMEAVSVNGLPRLAAQALSGLDNVVQAMVMRKVISEFLARTGIPNLDEFDAIRGSLSPQIQFDDADGIAFRSRLAAWAITGSPHLPSRNELSQMKISFILPTEPIYLACVRNTDFHYEAGNILFRACFRSAYIPYGFLVKLCAKTYPTLDEAGNAVAPFTLEEAIDNWLFLQFINAIGGHSIA